MIIYEKLAELAKGELVNLKKHATRLELNRLAGQLEINNSNKYECIYGAMTGSCESERAMSLINLCSLQRVRDITNSMGVITEENFSNYPRSSFRFHKDNVFSPIETVLFLCTDNDVRNMFNYLTKDTELLPFEIDKWKYMLGRTIPLV